MCTVPAVPGHGVAFAFKGEPNSLRKKSEL